jgi:hypothetical protein
MKIIKQVQIINTADNGFVQIYPVLFYFGLFKQFFCFFWVVPKIGRKRFFFFLFYFAQLTIDVKDASLTLPHALLGLLNGRLLSYKREVNNKYLSRLKICIFAFMDIQSSYFRVNKKEYCHITDKEIFIFNSKTPTHIPEEHSLSEAWGILSILNYIFFIFIFTYTAISITSQGVSFFKNVYDYGVLTLLGLSFIRIQKGFFSSKTPTIPLNKIRSVYFKTPTFSYPRLMIYFEGPEGKVLQRTIPILYKKEAQIVFEKLEQLVN